MAAALPKLQRQSQLFVVKDFPLDFVFKKQFSSHLRLDLWKPTLNMWIWPLDPFPSFPTKCLHKNCKKQLRSTFCLLSRWENGRLFVILSSCYRWKAKKPFDGGWLTMRVFCWKHKTLCKYSEQDCNCTKKLSLHNKPTHVWLLLCWRHKTLCKYGFFTAGLYLHNKLCMF